MNDIPINPDLPADFDDCPNEDRPESHLDWWNRPYIQTEAFKRESYEEFRSRLYSYGLTADREPKHSPEEWDSDQDRHEQEWLKEFPSGTRYDVRCLDGGAWDRPTRWGSFATLEEAQHCAQFGPSWRR